MKYDFAVIPAFAGMTIKKRVLRGALMFLWEVHMIREPAVAGQFYPGSKSSLEMQVKKYLSTGAIPQRAIGVIAPHAGYIYSGKTAGLVYAATVIPETCIVLSPNHTGEGAAAALMDRGSWRIPTGEVPIDEDLATALKEHCGDVRVDATAHLFEHSLEVQLPFLLARQPKLTFVPLTLQHLRYEVCEKIGMAIATTIRAAKKDILIVASSDMNHYESEDITRKKDTLAIDKVLALDPKGLLMTCAEHRITMCGVIPAAIMLIAARELGATKAELVSHTTSGDTSGDYQSVVGYAGIRVT